MEGSNLITEKADNYIFKLFKEADTSKLLYHKYKHTYDVVQACKEIGEGSDLSCEDMEILLLAAWFHDVGYLVSCEKHEEISVKEATKFLMTEEYDEVKIKKVVACIMATELNAHPANLLEKIICDADMKGISESSYEEKAKLLREEFVLTRGIELEDDEWLEKELEFLTRHQFHTKYAQLNFNKTKSKNLKGRRKEYYDLIKGR